MANLLPLLIFSLIAGTLPDFLFYVGIGNVQSLQAGVILLLEPLSSMIISATLMLASVGLPQIAGAALILLSNYAVIRTSVKPSQQLKE